MKQNNRIGFRFSKQNAWKFFLLVAFPIHLWALILWFLDFETVAQRTNIWDAVGEGSYFLIFAFFESVVIFSMLSLLLLLLPKRTEENKVFLMVTTLYLVIAGWFILEQARFLPFLPVDNWLIKRLQLADSLRSNTGKALLIGFLSSAFLSSYLVNRYAKLSKAIASLSERVGTLSILYLLLDFFGFVIVILRNV